MSRTISEDVLKGIVEALSVHAPHLLPTIHNLIHGGLFDGAAGNGPMTVLGTTTYGTITASISWEDGEPILRALEAIERNCGEQVSFAGVQIYWLIVSWKQFAEPRQLPQKS